MRFYTSFNTLCIAMYIDTSVIPQKLFSASLETYYFSFSQNYRRHCDFEKQKLIASITDRMTNYMRLVAMYETETWN